MNRMPRLDDIPIPPEVRPGPGWTRQMLEMADHIGPYPTMQIVDHFCGQRIYVPRDPDRNPFRDVVGPHLAGVISRVYGTEHLAIPVARHARDHARRGGILAMVRNGEMTARAAAIILGTSRTYLTHLLNNTDEDGIPPAIFAPAARRHDPRQIDMFGDDTP